MKTQPDLNIAPVPNSPHVVTAAGKKGDTPAVWNAVGSPVTSGPWEGVDQESGPADPSGHATGPFEDGPGGWEQT